MFDWYRNYRAWKAESRALGGVNELGLDIEDDRPWLQKVTTPYEPEENLVDMLRRLERNRPELFR